MRLTLRARLALTAGLATALAAVLVAVGLFVAVNRLLWVSQVEGLQNAASAVQVRVERALDESARSFGVGVLSSGGLERLADADAQTRGLELRLSGPGGQVQTPRFPAEVDTALPPDVYTLDGRLLAVRSLRGGGRLAVLSDAPVLTEARRAFTRALAWLLPLVLALAAGLGYAVAGRLLAPVRRLEGAARRIGAGGDLRSPLPGAGEGDELARLARTLEGAFGRVADARDREQDFVRAAAHDLRSPLAALTARVDATLTHDREPERYRAELRELGTDLTRLSTLTNHLLLLARDPAALSREAVPLRDLAAEAVDRARELSPEADVDLIAPQALTTYGDRVLLGQAVWNLTANALLHAPGAAVTVTVRPDGAGGAEVEVRDDGPGVDAATLARLGEAFYRPDASRTAGGHGLGLALARRAAEVHGGELRLWGAPGGGFTATLHLPARGGGGVVRSRA
ncbi:HAMP domain-containing histidine kinase [Deinococcus sp. SDU3-2]|uniref:histidine kinase n=1 Tax=Deinococcus terrestris TaxID=2651870 RepID=A0A7X1TRC2_9DEIO|nr:HAMP domain-containing sensor histidine kinase [Deinococcus terrestris]MPY66643.1 HAMP domain-containing histidine kinase [Deinococcus terrestris]